jgi:hypothetical protein
MAIASKVLGMALFGTIPYPAVCAHRMEAGALLGLTHGARLTKPNGKSALVSPIVDADLQCLDGVYGGNGKR